MSQHFAFGMSRCSYFLPPVVLSETTELREPAPLPLKSPPLDSFGNVPFTKDESLLHLGFGPLVTFIAKFDFATEYNMHVPSSVRVTSLLSPPLAVVSSATPWVTPPSPPSAGPVSLHAAVRLSPFVESMTPLNPNLDGDNVDHNFETKTFPSKPDANINVMAEVAPSASPEAAVVLAKGFEENVKLPTETALKVPWVGDPHGHLIIAAADFTNDAEHPDPVECLKLYVNDHSDLLSETQ